MVYSHYRPAIVPMIASTFGLLKSVMNGLFIEKSVTVVIRSLRWSNSSACVTTSRLSEEKADAAATAGGHCASLLVVEKATMVCLSINHSLPCTQPISTLKENEAASDTPLESSFEELSVDMPCKVVPLLVVDLLQVLCRCHGSACFVTVCTAQITLHCAQNCLCL